MARPAPEANVSTCPCALVSGGEDTERDLRLRAQLPLFLRLGPLDVASPGRRRLALLSGRLTALRALPLAAAPPCGCAPAGGAVLEGAGRPEPAGAGGRAGGEQPSGARPAATPWGRAEGQRVRDLGTGAQLAPSPFPALPGSPRPRYRAPRCAGWGSPFSAPGCASPARRAPHSAWTAPRGGDAWDREHGC